MTLYNEQFTLSIININKILTMIGKRWPSNQIRGELLKKDIKIRDIYVPLRTSRQMVGSVIKGKIKAGKLRYQIQKKISTMLGERYHEVWGEVEPDFVEHHGT